MAHRAKAEYLGGTKVRYTCPEGHQWVEDLGRKSLPVTKRLSEGAVRMMANWWASGVSIECGKCERAKVAA